MTYTYTTPYGEGWQNARESHRALLLRAVEHEQEMLEIAIQMRANREAGTALHIRAEMECHARQGAIEALDRLISVYSR